MSSVPHHSSRQKINKWLIDMTPRRSDSQKSSLSNPPGYTTDRQTLNEVGKSETESNSQLVDKKSWDIALGPFKNIPMNLFMMYMAGNTISIFPIMMVGMMAFRPIQALMSIRNTMKMLEHSQQYVLMVIAFVMGNLAALALGVYKCNSMGLLPTHESDWLSFLPPIERTEYSAGGIV